MRCTKESSVLIPLLLFTFFCVAFSRSSFVKHSKEEIHKYDLFVFEEDDDASDLYIKEERRKPKPETIKVDAKIDLPEVIEKETIYVYAELFTPSGWKMGRFPGVQMFVLKSFQSYDPEELKLRSPIQTPHLAFYGYTRVKPSSSEVDEDISNHPINPEPLKTVDVSKLSYRQIEKVLALSGIFKTDDKDLKHSLYYELEVPEASPNQESVPPRPVYQKTEKYHPRPRPTKKNFDFPDEL